MEREIPDIVISRLPLYLRALTHIANEGVKNTTSSHELGRRLGISSAQIRKDLSHFGEFGKQGTGYHIDYLISQLREILQLDREHSVAVIGSGFLGHAVANYDGFSHRGFRIRLVFDNDPEKVGEQMRDITVQHVSEMKASIERERTQIAILAVPAHAAQETADLVVQAGVKAILNYAPININVPEGVIVRYSDPVVQMQRMSYYLD